jgi:hypothetical protein
MHEVKGDVVMRGSSANTRRRELSHMVGIPVAIATALLGLGLYLVSAGFFGWMDPIWWGGKALFFPIFGAPCVAISSIVFHIVMTWLCNTLNFQIFSYIVLVMGEALVGLLFFPCFYILIFVIRTVPGIWPDLGLSLWPIWLALAISSALSIAFSCAIVLSWLRIKKVSPRSGDNP